MQAGPATRWIELIARYNKSEFSTFQAQAGFIGFAAIKAHKCVNVFAANRQHLGGDYAAIAQSNVLGLFLHGQLSIDLHKSKQIQGQLAAGLQQRPLAAISR